jgi:hypothetical protein
MSYDTGNSIKSLVGTDYKAFKILTFVSIRKKWNLTVTQLGTVRKA